MTDRLLVDLGVDGRVSVLAWPEGEAFPSPAGEPVELGWPLDADALEELRWYLEDYLRAPFDVTDVLILEPFRPSGGRRSGEPGILDQFNQILPGKFADPACPQQHRWVPVEMRRREERRSVILDQCLFVGLRRHQNTITSG